MVNSHLPIAGPGTHYHAICETFPLAFHSFSDLNSTSMPMTSAWSALKVTG